MKISGLLTVIFLTMCSFGTGAQSREPDMTVEFKVTIPDVDVIWPGRMEEIPPYEFADRKNLVKVKIEEGVRIIGEYAFLGCENLEEISLPHSLEAIGEGAFRECRKLKEITLPPNVKVIPRYMCDWDSSLKNVNLPSGLEDIGSHAFAYCENLEAICFPQGLKHIGSNAFSFDKALKTVDLPDSMDELESYAFSDCESLEKAILPANDKMLGELLFTGCRNLHEIVCLSPVPPTFDCGSPLFDPLEADKHERCRILVLPSALPLFREAPVWKEFRDITSVK